MTAPDHRPQNCRFRLYDEGKPYPKSSCSACGATIVTGLGTSCSRITPLAEALSVPEVKALVEAAEMARGYLNGSPSTALDVSAALDAALRAIGEGRNG